MTRDPAAFPDDHNGDALWNLVGQGEDLSIPREVDFAVLFPSEDNALKFAVHLLRNEQKVSFSAYEESDEMPWQVLVHPFMELTYANVDGFEKLLAEAAEAFDGVNDGWGCESYAAGA